MYAKYVFFDPDRLFLAFFPILGLGPFFEKWRFWPFLAKPQIEQNRENPISMTLAILTLFFKFWDWTIPVILMVFREQRTVSIFPNRLLVPSRSPQRDDHTPKKQRPGVTVR